MATNDSVDALGDTGSSFGTSGDVAGPASATDNAITRFDGTTGKLIQNSSVTIADGGAISAGTSNGTDKSLLISHDTNGRAVDVQSSGTGYTLTLKNTATPIYNDNLILLELADEYQHGHIAWRTASDGKNAVQITAHELTTGGGVHDHMSIYTTNSSDAARNRFNLEFQQDYPDVMFQRIGTVQVWNGFLGNDEPDAELKNHSIDDNALEVVYSLRSTDGGTYTKEGYVASFRNQKSITSGTIADNATVLRIEQAGDTGEGISMLNSSTGNGITVTQTGDVGSTASSDGALYVNNTSNPGNGLVVFSNMGSSANGPLAYIVGTSATFDQPVARVQSAGTSSALYVDMNGNAQGILVDHDDTGTNPSIDVDRDGNSASKIWGQRVTVDNAGAGGVGGIDFSGMGVDEAILKGTADPITTAGTVSHQIPIDIGGTIYYLTARTHGS